MVWMENGRRSTERSNGESAIRNGPQLPSQFHFFAIFADFFFSYSAATRVILLSWISRKKDGA